MITRFKGSKAGRGSAARGITIGFGGAGQGGGTVIAPTGAYAWGYGFPAAESVTVGKIKPWQIGTSLPSHSVGDIILGYGPLAALTGDTYGPSGMKGPLVIIGTTHWPTGHLYGQGHFPATPYLGVDNIWAPSFASNAQSHAPWKHEADQAAVNWPFIFMANIKINWSVNDCNFADFVRPTIQGEQTNDPVTHRLRGPKCAIFLNKIYLERGPHYADNEVKADGSQYVPPHEDQFHADGLQDLSSVPVWRVADCFFNWIMGQNFYQGREAEDVGFPRTTRQKYKNVSWLHANPWKGSPPVPNPNTTGVGSLTRNPRMIMNSEGAAGAVERDDYNAGQYFAALFESQCYIKGKFTVASDINYYLAPQAGQSGRDANGNWIFSNAVKGDHTFPAWNGPIKYIVPTGTLPQTCDPAHAGFQLRVTTAVQLVDIVRGNAGPASGLAWYSGFDQITDGNIPQIDAFAAWRGRPVDVINVFHGGGYFNPGNTWSQQYNSLEIRAGGTVETALDYGVGVAFAQPLLLADEYQQFDLLDSGARDTQHRTIAQQMNRVVRGRSNFWLRIGWEANKGFPWSLDTDAVKSPGDLATQRTHYVAGYRRIASIYKEEMPGVKIVWNHLRTSNTLIGNYYPGTSYVDIIGLDYYDNGPSTWMNNLTNWNAQKGSYNSGTGAVSGIEGFRDFALDKGKPMSFCEWGEKNVSYNKDSNPNPSPDGSNNSYFIPKMFEFFQSLGSTMAYESYFNGPGQHRIYPAVSWLPLPSAAYLSTWTP